MIHSLVIILGQFVVLSVLGLAALSALPTRNRELLLPAAPVFGAALLATVMSTTSRFWPALWGLLATVLVAAGIVVVAAYKGRRPWALSRSSLRTAALVTLVCTPGLYAALIPSGIVGDNLAVMPNGNHDAYYYAAESTWLRDNAFHPGPNFSSVPGHGNATPAYGPMRNSLDAPLRIGQPMVHAALDVVLAKQSVETVTPLEALWAFLVGPAAFVAARLLRARFGAALAAAALSASSAVLAQQVYQQNQDSLLGASLAILSIATVLAVLQAARRVTEEPPAVSASEAPNVGLWPAALVLTALVAVYTEYALFVAPAILGAVFLSQLHGLALRLKRLATIGLLAIALAPGAWWIALQGLRVDKSGTTGISPFFSDGLFYSLSRALGATPVDGTTDSHRRLFAIGLTIAFLGLAMVIGHIASIVLSPHRGAWIAMLLVAVPYVSRLTMKHLGYSQYRAIGVVMPILILVAVVGLGEVYPRIRGLLARTKLNSTRLDRGLVAACALAVVATAAVNFHAASMSFSPVLVRRLHYDGTYAQARKWTKKYGGKDGREVSVVNPDLTSQFWITYTMRDLRLVSYPRLRLDYLSRLEYWGGEIDPYYLVGTGGIYAGGNVVEKNARFTLVNVSDRPGVVSFPTDQMLAWVFDANEDGSMIGFDRARMIVLASHLAPGQRVVLTIRTNRDSAPVSASVDEREVATTTVIGGIAKLTFDVNADAATTVRIDLGRDGVVTPGSFDLIGIDLVSGVPSSARAQGQ